MILALLGLALYKALILAAVAVPRFVTTRTDAQVAMARSDIASTLKAIPARVFAENLDPTASTPSGFSNWGEWMIDTGGLDRGRWAASDNNIYPIISSSSSTNDSSGPCGTNLINIDTAGNLNFDPNNNITVPTGDGKTFCETLKNSYPSGSNRVIPHPF